MAALQAVSGAAVGLANLPMWLMGRRGLATGLKAWGAWGGIMTKKTTKTAL